MNLKVKTAGVKEGQGPPIILPSCWAPEACGVEKWGQTKSRLRVGVSGEMVGWKE